MLKSVSLTAAALASIIVSAGGVGCPTCFMNARSYDAYDNAQVCKDIDTSSDDASNNAALTTATPSLSGASFWDDWQGIDEIFQSIYTAGGASNSECEYARRVMCKCLSVSMLPLTKIMDARVYSTCVHTALGNSPRSWLIYWAYLNKLDDTTTAAPKKVTTAVAGGESNSGTTTESGSGKSEKNGGGESSKSTETTAAPVSPISETSTVVPEGQGSGDGGSSAQQDASVAGKVNSHSSVGLEALWASLLILTSVAVVFGGYRLSVMGYQKYLMRGYDNLYAHNSSNDNNNSSEGVASIIKSRFRRQRRTNEAPVSEHQSIL